MNRADPVKIPILGMALQHDVAHFGVTHALDGLSADNRTVPMPVPTVT